MNRKGKEVENMNKKSTLGKALVATAVGVAAGAAVAGLSNKENRKKVGKLLTNLSEKARDMANDAKKNPHVKKALKKGLLMANDVNVKARPMAKKIAKRTKGKVAKKLK